MKNFLKKPLRNKINNKVLSNPCIFKYTKYVKNINTLINFRCNKKFIKNFLFLSSLRSFFFKIFKLFKRTPIVINLFFFLKKSKTLNLSLFVRQLNFNIDTLTGFREILKFKILLKIKLFFIKIHFNFKVSKFKGCGVSTRRFNFIEAILLLILNLQPIVQPLLIYVHKYFILFGFLYKLTENLNK